MEAERLQRARLSLEGLSLGDAYGNHHGSNTRKHASPVWEYSDDTEMALSVFWSLRQYGRIHQDELAQRFAAHRNGNRGYGKGVTALLKQIRAGADWRKAAFEMFDGQGSYGNGAAMRAAPVGAYFADDIQAVVEQARLSAEVTHAHPEGIAGAVAVAVGVAVAYANRNSLPERKPFLTAVCEHVPDSEVKRKIELACNLDASCTPCQAAELLGNGRPSLAQFTVPFALWSAGRYLTSYEEAIRKTAGVGGDVDTNCAIVGGIVSLSAPAETMPLDWLSRREPLPAWPFEDADHDSTT